MMIRVTVVISFVLLSVLAQAQNSGQHKSTALNEVVKTSEHVNENLPDKSSAKEAAMPGTALFDVLIATNEDCLFLLNGEVKGLALKDTFLYIKLPAGTYRYTARNPQSGDVHSDTFSVAKGQLNEIFIDMLYVMDVESEKRATALQNGLMPQKESVSETGSTANEQELNAISVLVADMVVVKGGSFVMGNNQSPAADEVEHQVMLNDFSMGKYEVTQQQWEALMGYNPSLNKDCAFCPVENVTWEEVMKFVRKINSISNRKFRLPTEAEWEYVARFGGKAEIEKAGGVEVFIRNTAWSYVNSDQRTHPVGKKQPNAAGIYDLFGNVSEWCMDWYGAFFYKEEYTEKNPEGPPLGKEKIIRGGNYKDYVGDRFRPSFRNKMNPKSKGSEIGFRLVMEVL